MKHITLPNGEKYEWKELRRIRREQILLARRTKQPTLFEIQEDTRPVSQRTVAGRYKEPWMFE